MPVGLLRRNSPVMLTLPYTGVNMPRILFDRLEDQSRFFSAPDRFLARLLDGRADAVTILQANFHRFVSDVDYMSPAGERGPSKGMMGTVPILDVDGSGIWSDPPSMKEAASWRAMYFAPFHAALAAQIARVRAQFGHAVIVNLCARHTGDSGDFSMSTGRGATCGADLSLHLQRLLQSFDEVAIDIDAGIKPGRITRHYGRPSACCHAIDVEIAERCYLNISNDDVLYDPLKAAPVAQLLEELIAVLNDWRPS